MLVPRACTHSRTHSHTCLEKRELSLVRQHAMSLSVSRQSSCSYCTVLSIQEAFSLAHLDYPLGCNSPVLYLNVYTLRPGGICGLRGRGNKNMYGRQREQTQPTSTVKMTGVNGPVKSVNGMNYEGEDERNR